MFSEKDVKAGLLGTPYDQLEDRRVVAHEKAENHDKTVCSQLTSGGCAICAHRPDVCRYYPFMLYYGELTVSLSCPWVVQKFLPMLSESIANFPAADLIWLKSKMFSEIPQEILDLWDKDQDDNRVVIKLNV